MHPPLRRLVGAAVAAIGLPALLAAQTTTPAAAAELSEEEYLRLGRKYTEWFYAGAADSIFAHMTPDMQGRGGVNEVAQKLDQFAMRAGNEDSTVAERMTRRQGRPQYWRESRYSGFQDEALVLRFVFDPAGAIAGIGMGPRSQTPAPD